MLLLALLLASRQAAAMQNSNREKSLNPYEPLNQKAANSRDAVSIRDLFIDIQLRTLGHPLPESLTKRLVNVQCRFQEGKQSPVTEAALAHAINRLGHRLNPVVFSGTNELQIHLLRLHMRGDLANLLTSPVSSMPRQETLSPPGAVYMGFLLLRQKLANRAWFGNPDEQNKIWIAAEAKRPNAADTKYQHRVTVQDEPMEETNFRLMMKIGLEDEHSMTTKAFREFLDSLGF